MRLSIWQQFSSNHSGFYWVVGTFETVENAQKAYKEIRDMLYSINNWHLANPEESETAFHSGNTEPLPIEKEFAQKYDVQWPRTIDWTNWPAKYPDLSERLISEAVSIIGRTVEVTTPDDTWMGIQPFEGILARLGAETFGVDLDLIESASDEELEIHPRLTFAAPNIDAADQLEAAFREERYKASTQNEAANLLKRLGLLEAWVMKRNMLDFSLYDLRFLNDKHLTLFIEWLESKKFTRIDFVYVRRLED